MSEEGGQVTAAAVLRFKGEGGHGILQRSDVLLVRVTNNKRSQASCHLLAPRYLS